MGTNIENTPQDPTAAGYWVLLDPDQFPGLQASAQSVDTNNRILKEDGTLPTTLYLYDTVNGFVPVPTSDNNTTNFYVDPESGHVYTTTAYQYSANLLGDNPVYLSASLDDPFIAGIALLDSSGNVVVSGEQIRTANQHTLQSLIEVNYVREGNRIMGSALSGLDDAISATESAISVLGDIQNLHNSITVEALDPLEFQYWVAANTSEQLSGIASNYIWRQIYAVVGHDNFQNISNTSQLLKAYKEAYNAYASAYFGLPIFPEFQYASYEAEGFQTEFLPDFQAMRDKLSNTIETLSGVDGQLRSDSTTLAGKLQKVLDDMPNDAQLQADSPTEAIKAFRNVKSWAMDYYRAYEGENYMTFASATDEKTRIDTYEVATAARYGYNDNFHPSVTQIILSINSNLTQDPDLFYNSNLLTDASKAGSIQDNITFAITAAQSLNDSQKEEVRRYMYVFEEYYKSASAMLTKISQIIEKLAQGIRPA